MINETFKNPPKEFRVAQYGNASEKDEDYDVLDEYGIGGIVVLPYGRDHLKNPETMQKYIRASRKAKERGFQVWTYDEQGYPSGMAGGRVVEENPEYESRGLFCMSKKLKDFESANFTLPSKSEKFIYAAAYRIIGGKVIYDNAVEADFDEKSAGFSSDGNEYRFCVFGIEKLRETTQAATTMNQFGHTGLYPSLLSHDAVRSFINLTHEAFFNKMGVLSDYSDLFYSGEPNLNNLHFTGEREAYQAFVPFDPCVPDRFRQMHGYDIVPFLGALFADGIDEYMRIRLHYYRTIGDLMSNSFSGQISKWCSEHGTRLAGHLLLEEDISWQVPVYGDFWKVMWNFHIPGADMPIIASTANRGSDLLGMKYVTSIARLQSKLSQCLMDPIIGGHHTIDNMPVFELMMDNVNYICYSGASIISTYGDFKSFGKENYSQYNLYAGRLCMLLRGAKDTSQTAVYYPVASFQARFVPDSEFFWKSRYLADSSDLQQSQIDIIEAMKNNAIDCNFLDDQAILDARITGTALCIAGYEYKAIIIPSVDVMPEKVLAKITEFRNAGGDVFFAGKKPYMGIYEDEDARVIEMASGFEIKPVDDIADAIKRTARGILTTDANPAKMYISSYLKDGKKMFFLADRVGENHKINVDIAGVSRILVFEPQTGEIRYETLPATVDITRFRSVILLET
ncbi:MAG: hypothetical protein ACYCYI_03465 [Saccharofermentanales bacterium]